MLGCNSTGATCRVCIVLCVHHVGCTGVSCCVYTECCVYTWCYVCIVLRWQPAVYIVLRWQPAVYNVLCVYRAVCIVLCAYRAVCISCCVYRAVCASCCVYTECCLATCYISARPIAHSALPDGCSLWPSCDQLAAAAAVQAMINQSSVCWRPLAAEPVYSCYGSGHRHGRGRTDQAR